MKNLFTICLIIVVFFLISSGCKSNPFSKFVRQAGCPVIDGPAPKTAEEYIERAEKYNEGNHPNIDCALDASDSAVQLDPKNPKALACRGDFHRLKGEYDLALADANKAIEVAPESYLGYSLRSLVYKEHIARFSEDRDFTAEEKDLLNKALVDLSMAIKLYPNTTAGIHWLYQHRGELYFKTGDYDHAIYDYSEAIRLKPDYSYFYADRADVYLKKGDNDNAVKDYTEAIRLDSDKYYYYADRARAYRKLGKTALAEADEQKSKELEQAEKDAKNK